MQTLGRPIGPVSARVERMARARECRLMLRELDRVLAALVMDAGELNELQETNKAA